MNLSCLDSRSAPRIAQIASAAVISVAIMACAPGTRTLVGTARAPISSDRVEVYVRPPLVSEEVALLDVSRNNLAAGDLSRNENSVVESLKEQAAKLGANGVVLETLRDPAGGSSGRGRAIYVPTG